MSDAGCRERVYAGRVISWELNGQTRAKLRSRLAQASGEHLEGFTSPALSTSLHFELPNLGIPGHVVMPIMGKQILIRLDEIDVGQVLDGLQLRADSWRATERYFETGNTPEIIEECTDGNEAHAIAECYERIIASITSQRNRQLE